MIKPESIEELRDALDVLSTIERFSDVKLKKRGAVYVGCCPFHDEKSPSFTVSTSKQIYKCFGCGEGGDPIKFVMKKQRMDFIPAIRALAEWKNFQLDELEETPEEKDLIAKKQDLISINKAAAKKYREKLESLLILDPVKQEIFNTRQLLQDTVSAFELGFAPNQWDFLAPKIVDQGQYSAGIELGLIATSNNRNYDVYRNRIMFPIHDPKGHVVGFGGRKVEDDNRDNPKYINAKESPVYHKDKILYGIFQAQKAIRDMGYAVLVEGYYDVLSCHQSGLSNTVGSCGTALTSGQAQLLKRYTNHVIMFYDGDDAGKKAALKSVNILLKEGFKVDICLLPADQDPDSFARLHPLVLSEFQEENN